MRPYAIKKDDPKFIQANVNNPTGIQPSPLALLAATCSRIGDTFHEESHPVFTHKSLTNFIDKKIVHDSIVRSCLLDNSRANDSLADRTLTTLDLQHNQPSFSASHQQTLLAQQQQHQQQQHLSQPQHSSCLKIKTEQSLDYNHNCTEGMHICPNIVNETRMLESQARASFNKSCCHEPTQSPTACGHQQTNSPTDSSLPLLTQQQPSSCQHDNTLSHIPSPSSSSSSCLFQPSPSGTSQSPSCALTTLEPVKYPHNNNTLSHLPMSTTNTTNNNSIYCDNSYSRQKTAPSINPWQNQSIQRGITQQESQKSSCMLHENYAASISTTNIQTNVIASSPQQQERSFRTYSPEQERQFASNFRSPEYPSSVDSHQSSTHYGGTPSLHSPHQQQQTFDNYGSYENHMDVKPDPYTLHQQSMRGAGHPSSLIPGASYDNHAHPMSTLHGSPEPLNMAPSLQSSHYLGHTHPSAMNYGNGYPGNYPISQTPDLVPGNPMAGPSDMVPPNFVDYQYQQQMFYSRENRRPRRIACTCPNCRDGENKTVTTKDGKQRKLHICHILGCGKEYGKTSHLRAHLRWHAGERPFACNWLFCNKRFTRSDELQRHRRTHTGDKRFECSTCLKKFMRSDHLSKHMKTHQSQNKQGKDKGSDSSTSSVDKTKATVSKTTHLNKQQSEMKSKITSSMGLTQSLDL